MKNVQHFAQLTIFHDFSPRSAGGPAGNLHKSGQSICDTWRARLVGAVPLVVALGGARVVALKNVYTFANV